VADDALGRDVFQDGGRLRMFALEDQARGTGGFRFGKELRLTFSLQSFMSVLNLVSIFMST